MCVCVHKRVCTQTHRLTYTQVINTVLKLPNNPGMAACPYNLKGEADRQTPRIWWLCSWEFTERPCLEAIEDTEEPSILFQLWKTPGQTHTGSNPIGDTVIPPATSNGEIYRFVTVWSTAQLLDTISRENLSLKAELPWRSENKEQFQGRELQIALLQPQGEKWPREEVSESRRAQFRQAIGWDQDRKDGGFNREMVRKKGPPPFMDRSRSHQLRITLKSDSSEPEVTGGSVSGANCLLSVVGELMNYAFPGVVLGSAASFKGGLQSTKSRGIWGEWLSPDDQASVHRINGRLCYTYDAWFYSAGLCLSFTWKHMTWGDIGQRKSQQGKSWVHMRAWYGNNPYIQGRF